MSKLIIYGYGQRGKSLCSALNNTDMQVLFFVDSDEKKWGLEYEGISVCSPSVLTNYKTENICIAISDEACQIAIRKKIVEEYDFAGEEKDFYSLIYAAYIQQYEKIRDISLSFKNEFKVLFDCHNGLVMGGIELWIIDLCEQLLKDNKFNIGIISDAGRYDVSDQILEIVDKVNFNHREGFGIETFINIVRYLEQQMPFVVITSFPDIVLVAASILKRKYPDSVYIISVIHHGENEFFNANAIFMNQVNKYIGVSEDIKGELLKRKVPEEKILSMTCPVKCEDKLMRGYRENGIIHIGYAGRLVVYKKRMDLLIKLIKELEKKNINYVFEIAGEGTYREEMEKFIRENKLDKKVLFLGRIAREDIFDFWKRQDVCVNISDCEGRCISKMEGMSAGAIPIVTDVIGMREDITDGINGYIVPMGDYKSIAEKIEYLYLNCEKLPIMGKCAHEEIRKKCKMSDHVRFWEKVLNGCY